MSRSVTIAGPGPSGSITAAAPTWRSDISRATSLSVWRGPTVRTIGLIPSLTCIVASRVGQRVGHPVAPPAADASAAGPPPGDLQLLPQSSTPTFPRQVQRDAGGVGIRIT